MRYIAENIWIFDGEAVKFYSLPYTTRMTVIALSNGDLWVHSPIKLEPALQAKVETLGLQSTSLRQTAFITYLLKNGSRLIQKPWRMALKK